jgi:DNA-binding beta-propeller fold protein YncE
MGLVPAGFIAIPPGPASGFDHADVYLGAEPPLLYVAHTGADRVDVIDCVTNTFVRSLPDHPGVAGILVDNPGGLLFTSDRAAARVSIYRCPGERLVGRITVGDRPNGLAYDAQRHRLFSFNLGEPIGENCTASVVDLGDAEVGEAEVVATIPLPGRPRWAVFDPESDRIFANIANPAQIAVIDPVSLRIGRVIEVPAAGPHGLWVRGGRLYCAADGRVLVVLRSDTGAVIAEVPLPGVPDVVMFDSGTDHLYVAVGDPGVVCVIDAVLPALIETVPTGPGAHTIAVEPRSHTLYAFLPAAMGASVFVDR